MSNNYTEWNIQPKNLITMKITVIRIYFKEKHNADLKEIKLQFELLRRNFKKEIKDRYIYDYEINYKTRILRIGICNSYNKIILNIIDPNNYNAKILNLANEDLKEICKIFLNKNLKYKYKITKEKWNHY